MLSPQGQVIAQQILEQLRAKATQPVRRVILYGSRSRGTARPDSDYDFLVIVKDQF